MGVARVDIEVVKLPPKTKKKRIKKPQENTKISIIHQNH